MVQARSLQLLSGVQQSNVIGRAWAMHVGVIGVLAVTCIAICINQWPVNEAPQESAASKLILTSGALVVYAVFTTLLLPTRRRIVYALHVTGLAALVALATA